MTRSFPLFSFIVALRYLRSTRRDAFITFLSATAAGGVALGVAALILSLAALSGFQRALRDEVLARTPHIELTLAADVDLQEVLAIARSTPGVQSAQMFMRGRGWLLAAGRARPVEIVGFGGELPPQFPGATDRRTGLYVSRRIADAWGLEPGQVAEVVSTWPTLTPLGPQPRVKRLALVGTFEAGRSEQEERIAVAFQDAALLLDAGNRRVILACSSLREAIETAAALRPRLPEGTALATWRDLNQVLFFALRLEKTLIFVAVFLIVVVAAMGLVSDLMLILATKQPEIGMLGAMGARPEGLRRIFLWLGGLLVAVGAAVGVLLGVGGAWLLDRYRVLSLPEQVYFLDRVPFLVRPADVAAILVVTLALSLGCSWVAASRAAALRPVEALRR